MGSELQSVFSEIASSELQLSRDDGTRLFHEIPQTPNEYRAGGPLLLNVLSRTWHGKGGLIDYN